MTTPEHTYYTYYYQWSKWSEDPAQRRGFGRNPLVLYTFANTHLVHYINDIDSLVSSRPIGALILSMQAVERALECWTGGEKATKIPEFSKNNFGDTYEMVEKNRKRIRRATIFVKTLERFTDDDWTSIIEEGREYIEDSRRSAILTSSNASDNIVEDPAENFFMEL